MRALDPPATRTASYSTDWVVKALLVTSIDEPSSPSMEPPWEAMTTTCAPARSSALLTAQKTGGVDAIAGEDSDHSTVDRAWFGG